jgi:nitrogenase subunit NifH
MQRYILLLIVLLITGCNPKQESQYTIVREWRIITTADTMQAENSFAKVRRYCDR